MNQAFDAYQKYVALKQHFTREGYDYFRYGGKVNAKLASFEARKDRFFFYKLAKKKDLENFLVANFVDHDVSWVRDLLGNEAEQTYVDWLKRQQSLSYIFANDVEKLDDDLNQNFLVKNGQHPHLLSLFLRKEISFETLVILIDVFKFKKHWDEEIQDDVIWPDVRLKCLKYRPFLKYEKTNFKDILRKRFT